MKEIDPKTLLEHAILFDDNIVVQEYPPEKITPGGIERPHTALERKLMGWIMAVGEGAKDLCAVGDTVLYVQSDPIPLPELGASMLLMRLKDTILFRQ